MVNKIDILTDPAEKQQVITFVTDAANKLVGDVQAVFATSAKQAQKQRPGSPNSGRPAALKN